MKKILLSLVAMMIATVSFAQTSLLATLSHDGSVSTFYGTTALKEALEKADNGDAITLSAGQFQAANITKAITLRGAGMSVSNDSESSHESTIIQGDFEINLPEDVSERLIMEGLYFTSQIDNKGKIKNALFMKSRFHVILSSTDGCTEDFALRVPPFHFCGTVRLTLMVPLISESWYRYRASEMDAVKRCSVIDVA